MTSATGKILVISFYFPPYNKVGGRRWAKHCKYFEKEGINFNVLAGEFSGTSPWDKDIEPFANRITRVKIKRENWPYHLRCLPNGILDKVRWKLSHLTWEFRKPYLKGNYGDVSSGNENAFLEKAREIVQQHNTRVVIISVGPFKYSNILPILKREFPEIKFVIDYRDYWEDGFSMLTEKQKKWEKECQQRVLNAVDLVLSPNEEMTEFYATVFKKKSMVLPHCFDPDDLKDVSVSANRKTGVISILYGGAFYEKIEPSLELLKKLLDELAQKLVVHCEFYVSVKGFEKELEHPRIARYGFINSNEYFQKIENTDYTILILPPNRVNAMSSKFFELVAMKKPILYFGGEGVVSRFIEKWNLGFHITSENINNQVASVIENLTTCKIPDAGYNMTQHTFGYQTKQLISRLQQLG